MYSSKFTVLLLICLLIPFLLRLKNYEPYPAILFPSGPETIKSVKGTVKTEIKQLYALNPKGKWQRIEPKTFMYPAPAAYLTNLIGRDMGFKKPKPQLFNGRYGLVNHFFRFQRGNTTNANMMELHYWLKGRLTKSGFESSQIRVATYVHTISTINGEILKKELKNENYYNLD